MKTANAAGLIWLDITVNDFSRIVMPAGAKRQRELSTPANVLTFADAYNSESPNEGETMKSVFKKLFVLILTAIICVAAVNSPSARTVAQQPAKSVSLPGLHGRVTVRRDERGIPYIEATNDDDLYFAQGYVTASDRLWQMDVQRRAARGELAEIFGQAALGADKQHRTFGFAKVVDETAAHLPTDLSAVLNAYAKGVNAFIDSRTNQNLPPEFLILQYKPRPWTPADSLAVGKLMAEYLSISWPIDIMRAAMASLPKDKRDALLPEVSPLDVLVVGKDRNAAKATNRASLSPTRRPNADVLAAVAET